MSKRKTEHRQSASRAVAARRTAAARPATIWLYGEHPVVAALGNPGRHLGRLLLTPQAEQRLAIRHAALLAAVRGRCPVETVDRRRLQLAAGLPETAVHQGMALESTALEQPTLAALMAGLPPGRASLVALDQVTDPQNVGAVLRSAAAFGARAVIAPRHHVPPESGALAKAASGALDLIPFVQVANLARAIDDLKPLGFWCLGLAGDADLALPQAVPGERCLLVLGAEGAGLRQLTRRHCDLLVRLPTQPPLGDLNVAAAAAVALYELLGRAPKAADP